MTTTRTDILYAIGSMPNGDVADIFEMLMSYIDAQGQRIETLERALTADKRTLEERLLPASQPDPIEMFARLNTPPRYFGPDKPLSNKGKDE